MRAEQRRQRQPPLAAGIAEDHAIAVARCLPFPAVARKRRPSSPPRASNTASASGGCGPTTAGTPGLRMPAFSTAIGAQRVAEMLHMIERDRRQHAQLRAVDHVGRIEPAAEADLEQHHVGRRAREGEEGRAVVISKKVIGAAAVGALALLEQRQQRALVDQPAGEADALVEAHEMRRGVDVDAPARGLQHGAQIGDDRALAVGAGDMDDRRQAALRMAERGEQPRDAVERQVDQLRMQRGSRSSTMSLVTGAGGIGGASATRPRCRSLRGGARATGGGVPAPPRHRHPRWRPAAWRSPSAPERVAQQRDQPRQRVAQLGARHDHVDHAVLAADIRRAGSPPAASRGSSPRSRARRRSRSPRRARRWRCRRAWRRRR